MPNIIQQQELLKDLSDQQIAKEMQQPTGQMPLFLISSEAKRRADLRQRFKAEQAGPPPTTTVQEDLLNSILAAQQQPVGIAQGIPQQGQPQQPQMDPRMAQQIQQRQQAQRDQNAQQLQNAQGPRAPQRGYAEGGIVRGFADGGATSRFVDVDALKRGPGPRQGRAVPTKWAPPSERASAREKLQLQLAIAGSDDPSVGVSYRGQPSSAFVDAEDMARGPIPRSAEGYYSEIPGGPPSRVPTSAATGIMAGARPTANMPTPPSTDFGALSDARYAELTKGGDPYKATAASLAERKAGLEGASDKNAWLAAAQAGFGMAAGQSPDALTNIGTGALAGLGEYVKGENRIQDRADALSDKEAGLVDKRLALEASLRNNAMLHATGQISADQKDFSNQMLIKQFEQTAEIAKTEAASREEMYKPSEVKIAEAIVNAEANGNVALAAELRTQRGAGNGVKLVDKNQKLFNGVYEDLQKEGDSTVGAGLTKAQKQALGNAYIAKGGIVALLPGFLAKIQAGTGDAPQYGPDNLKGRAVPATQ